MLRKIHEARIEDYILGNCIGKGAFGSVYSGLNERTGETVAIKQINLLNIPKCEVDLIMMEIGLLKGLNHPNIVKYKGFIKTQENLNIIMEFCENGSLFHLRKKFGGFKENLVSNFVHKILLGLIYLHEQGILHRDLKCGNILTTKVAEVKLADFGVAAKLCDVQIDNVAGSPYWMAPEVIELNGATTASDIWSLGCTILEMIVGNPPYHTLAPMSALFRMVQDDHPPIPEYLSPLLRDFLLECFQKDPYLRISAKNLIKHPWIKSINGQPKSSSKVSEVSEVIGVKESWDEDFQENELEAKSMLLKNVKSLAEAEKMSSNWDEDFDVTNEKEFSFENCQKKKKDLPFHENEVFTRNEKLLGKELSKYNELAENQKLQLTNNSGLKGTPKKNFGYILPETELENNWDNDFEVEETHSNLVSAKQLTNLYDSEIKLNTFSAVEENLDNVHRFLDEENGNDWSDIFNFNVTLEKNRNNFKCPDSFEEDPFSNLEDNDENLENDANTNNWYISKSFEYDLKEKLNNKFDVLINNKTLSDQELIKICEYLGKTFLDNPIQKSIILKSHYLMPLLELLERQTKEFVILKLLKFLNQCIEDSVEILESFCLFGGIPIMLKFCKKYYSIDIRIESSIFIKYLCKNVEILKIFISCNGLKSFSEFFDEENFDINKKVLVENAADSIISVLNIQSVSKKDFCIIFTQEYLLKKLSSTFYVLNLDNSINLGKNEDLIKKILMIFLNFSKGNLKVMSSITNLNCFINLIKSFELLNSKNLVLLLKILKNCSMNLNVKVFENFEKSNLIFELKKILDYKNINSEVNKHSLVILFNVCRMSKKRTEICAKLGFIPFLKKIIDSSSSSRQFAIQIICDMVYCTEEILKNDVIFVYLRLLEEVSWQENVLKAILALLKESRNTKEIIEPILLNNLKSVLTNLQKKNFFFSTKTSKNENLSLNKLLELFLNLINTSKKFNLRILLSMKKELDEENNFFQYLAFGLLNLKNISLMIILLKIFLSFKVNFGKNLAFFTGNFDLQHHKDKFGLNFLDYYNFRGTLKTVQDREPSVIVQNLIMSFYSGESIQ